MDYWIGGALRLYPAQARRADPPSLRFGAARRWSGGVLGWWIRGLLDWWIGGGLAWWIHGLLDWWSEGVLGRRIRGLMGWPVARVWFQFSWMNLGFWI